MSCSLLPVSIKSDLPSVVHFMAEWDFFRLLAWARINFTDFAQVNVIFISLSLTQLREHTLISNSLRALLLPCRVYFVDSLRWTVKNAIFTADIILDYCFHNFIRTILLIDGVILIVLHSSSSSKYHSTYNCPPQS